MTSQSNSFEELLDARHSCRAFLPEPVARDVIEAILKVAQKTASWNNVQPWIVRITSGDATERYRNALAERAKRGGAEQHFAWPEKYEGVYQDRRRACGFQLYDAVGIPKGDKEGYSRQTMRNFHFFDAPHAAVITCDASLGVYGVLDCGAFVQNFLLAAESLGVASIAQGAIANFGDTVAAHFGIPENERVVCGISFGYEDKSDPVNQYRVPRAGIAEVATLIDT